MVFTKQGTGPFSPRDHFWLYYFCSKKVVSVMVPHICICHSAALESAQEARLALGVLPSQDSFPALLLGDFVSS